MASKTTKFKVLRVLLNKKEHLFSDIVKVTGLNKHTVANCLGILYRIDRVINKRIEYSPDIKFPYPVYYKLYPNSKVKCPLCGREIIPLNENKKGE